MKRLTVDELIALAEKGVNIIDIRPFGEFISAYFPKSIFFSIDGSIPSIFTKLVSKEDQFLLIISKENTERLAELFANNGYKNYWGYYIFDRKELEKVGVKPDIIVDIDPDEFGMDTRFDKKMVIADVRKYERYSSGHVLNAISFPLTDFNDLTLIADLDEKGSIYFYGTNEVEAVTAASILKKYEIHNLRIVNGGWKAISKEPEIRKKTPKGL